MTKYYTCLTILLSLRLNRIVVQPQKSGFSFSRILARSRISRSIGKLNERKGDSASLFPGKTVHTKVNSRLMKLCFVDYKSTRRTGKI